MIKNTYSNQLTNNLNFKQHQRHHSYSNPQFIHHNSQNKSKHHKRSFSHNGNNLEVLKHDSSSINLYSDSKNSLNSLNSKIIQSSLSSLDFKGEAINFKATTDSLLESLNCCLEIMHQKEEEFYAKKLEQDLERKKKLEEMKQLANGTTNSSVMVNAQNVFNCGPDYFEEVGGPNSKIKEEEFFDALDAMLDKNDQQEEEKRQLKLRMKEIAAPSAEPVEKCDHPLWPEINKITLDQLYYARLEVNADLPNDELNSGSWQLFAEEGEMRLYRRELEIDGLVCDPLKAVHVVKGITGLFLSIYIIDY